MKTIQKVAACLLICTVTASAALVGAVAADSAETYAYLPDQSVYFYDVSTDYAWAAQAVDTLATANVIRGNGNYLFEPAAQITRADFLVMLDRVYGMSTAVANGSVPSAGTFNDVPASSYYASSVNAAKAWGIATGYEGNYFEPQMGITRQDAMVFIQRTMDRANQTYRNGSIEAYSDAKQVEDYAQKAVSALVGSKIVSGDNGKLTPMSNMTRAEMAVILYRVTHMTEQEGGAQYLARKDIVNVCIGSQIYVDVQVSNYDAGQIYTGMMRYDNLDRSGKVTTIALGKKQPINSTAVYSGGQLTIRNADGTQTYDVADDCVSINVTHYHQLGQPQSTNSIYPHCLASVEDDKVVAIYYAEV